MRQMIIVLSLVIFFLAFILFYKIDLRKKSLKIFDLEQKTNQLEEKITNLDQEIFYLEQNIFKKRMQKLQIKNIQDYNDSLKNHLKFAVFADTPYNKKELNTIYQYLDILNQIDKNFIIHLGDIKNQNTDCTEESYSIISEVFLKSSSPVLFIPGDNEWNDCINPELGRKFWFSKLYKYEENWRSAPDIEYQNTQNENFFWIQNKVLIIGLNLVNGRIIDQEKWDFRLKQNAEWVQTQILRNKKSINAAIIFGHSSIKNKKNNNFNEFFIKIAQSFKKPILYMNGDEHRWRVRKPFPKKAPNVTQIVLKGGTYSPILITVNIKDKNDDPFKINTISLK